MTAIKVKFKQWDCVVKIKYYNDSSVSITLMDEECGDPVATATVYLPNAPRLPKHLVYIKEWSENEGMTQSLIDADVVRYTGLKEMVGPYGSYANVCEIVNNKILERIA